MKKIKYLLWGLIINILLSNNIFAEGECDYESEIKQCIDANLEGKSREIEDFVCLSVRKSTNKKGEEIISKANKEKIAFQVVLDKKFSEVDEIIETDLFDLEKKKGYYFGRNKSESYLQGIDDIMDKFKRNGFYWRKYNILCGVGGGKGTIVEGLECSNKEANIGNAKQYFNKSICMGLAEIKLNIYETIALNVLKLNKAQVRKDDIKRKNQEENSKYSEIMSSFSQNIGFLERIAKKTPALSNQCK